MKKIFHFSSILCCSLFIFFCSVLSHAQPGSFDPEFGDNGTGKRLVLDFDLNYTGDRTLEMPDGKIMFCGGAGPTNTFKRYPFLGRLNPDGSTDSSFADNGFVFLNFPPLNNEVYTWALLRQPDGKLLQSGRFLDSQTGKFSLFIVRYQENGLFDSTFANNGILLKTVPGFSLKSTVDLILQPDGKIIAPASKLETVANKSTILFFRFLPDGSPDPEFGVNGMVEHELGFSRHTAGYIELLPDGKIIAAGNVISEFNETLNLILRLNTNGTLDNTFGNDGWVLFSFSEAINQGMDDMTLTAEGDILTAGNVERLDTTTGYDFAIAKFHSDGSPDETFGNGGVFLRDNNNGYDDVTFIETQPDGKVLYAGETVVNFGTTMAFGRLNKDGTNDTDFGINGLVNTNDVVYIPDIIRQSNGTALISGEGYTTVTGFSRSPYYVARVLLDLNVGTFESGTNKNVLMFYPNPVHDQALLEYELQKDQNVEATIYTMDGTLVGTCLPKSRQTAGKHKEQLRIAPDLPAGNYVLKVRADDAVKTVRFIKM